MGGREGGNEGRKEEGKEGESEGRREGGRNSVLCTRTIFSKAAASHVDMHLSIVLPGAARVRQHLILQSGQLESRIVVFGIQMCGGSVGREV